MFDMHSWPVGFMFIMCLTKWLSWLGWDRVSPWSSFELKFVIMIFIFFECSIKFWAEVWILHLKKWLRSHGCWHWTAWKGPQSLRSRLVEAIRGLYSLGGLVMGVTGGIDDLKIKLYQGLDTLNGWLVPGGLLAPEWSKVLFCRLHFLKVI